MHQRREIMLGIVMLFRMPQRVIVVVGAHKSSPKCIMAWDVQTKLHTLCRVSMGQDADSDERPIIIWARRGTA